MKQAKFGYLIRYYRQKQGWTQAELAIKLGYDNSQFISLLERDQSKAPVYVLGQLIVLLGIPEEEVTKSLLSFYEDELKKQLDHGKRLAADQTA